MQNIIGKAVRPIDSEGYEILRSIQAYEYKKEKQRVSTADGDLDRLT